MHTRRVIKLIFLDEFMITELIVLTDYSLLPLNNCDLLLVNEKQLINFSEDNLIYNINKAAENSALIPNYLLYSYNFQKILGNSENFLFQNLGKQQARSFISNLNLSDVFEYPYVDKLNAKINRTWEEVEARLIELDAQNEQLRNRILRFF